MPLVLSRTTRLLVVVPHPDDESLAAGGLISAAVKAGAAVRVIYLTNGDNNPWPQRALERRWWVDAEGRARWGRRRQAEALAALEILGVPSEMVDFLNYPDQGITCLIMRGADAPAERIAAILETWRPTLLVTPCLADIHPDHSATAVFVRQAMALARTESDILWIEYLVHARRRPIPSCQDICLPLSQEQRAMKRAAISCHKTQLLLRPQRLLAHAESDEHFQDVSGHSESSSLYHPVRHCHWHGGILHLSLSTAPSPGAFGPIRLHFAGNHRSHARIRAAMRLPSIPRRKSVELVDTRKATPVGCARFDGGGRQATIAFDNMDWGLVDQLFVKVERSFGFFDEAGWGAISLPEELRSEDTAGFQVAESQ